MKIAVLTGGPSLERGISLNSARSVLDHLGSKEIEVVPIYFDQKKRAYKISKDQLYSNTPSDFDFKLSQNSSPLSHESLISLLKKVDTVFPAMHGPFCEDGEIQTFLEKNNIPFVGSGSKACKMAFDKYEANENIRKSGFFTLPSALLKIYSKDNKKVIEKFFKEHKIKRAIIKPASGGSSIGVFPVNNPREALEKAELIFSKRMDTRVVLEPFAKGREFTVIILENKLGMPVALMTTEVEPYKEGQIFDYRKKYLPTNQVKYHYPARFDIQTTRKILTQAEQLFKLFGAKDFARFDGWLLDSGEIWFSDFNTISGMEQNSFLFQQASRVGMSHNQVLKFILENSCRRQGISYSENISRENIKKNKPKKDIAVLFGGTSADSERQVSLMSGTNVWLKLRKSDIYNPIPYFLDAKGRIWSLPYSFILNHTVEEITANIENALHSQKQIQDLETLIRVKLLLDGDEATEFFSIPEEIKFTNIAKKHQFVFLALHGGDGENGNFQKVLKKFKTKYNGSDEAVSRLCMDKFATGEFIRALNIKGISTASQKLVSLEEISGFKNLKIFWEELKNELNAKTIIAKPKDDGCSTGVVHLYGVEDLEKYISLLQRGADCIPAHTMRNQDKMIEMPRTKSKEILFEKFIETDYTSVSANKLKYIRKSGFVEVTIGLLEEKGKMHALSPSITIAEGEVLSLEEKFQGGTGINLTPPPAQIVKPKAVLEAKKLVEELAQKIGLTGYARVDAFMNVTTGALVIIEVNTLPGLTPSTVLYHQALSENPPIFPVNFLEMLIKNKGY